MEKGITSKRCVPILAISLALSANMTNLVLATENDQTYFKNLAEEAASPPARFHIERFDSVSRPPAIGGVHVYYNTRDVKQPYQPIGLITASYEKNDQWNLSDETKLIDKIIGSARQLGANGLILQVSQPQSSGPVSMQGTAIVQT